MRNVKHYTYREIINSLLNNVDVAAVMDYIKTNQFTDSDINNLKNFLEKNNYNLEALYVFINPPVLLKAKKQVFNNWLLFKISAVIIFLGFAVFLFLSKSAKNKKNYFVDDEGFSVYMSSEAVNKLALYNGMSYYRIGEYENAVSQFKTIPSNDTANYYLGISFLKLNKPDSALIDLKKIDKNSKYYNRANYYLALSYLLTNKKDSCINILKSFQFNNLAMQSNRNTILNDIK
jgi:hypothetical protein